MRVEDGKRIPIKLWLDDIEDGAMEQYRNLAKLPFAYHHIAGMADSHQGYGMPIGGIIATRDVILPYCVGNDIGCSMSASKTAFASIEKEKLKLIMSEIRNRIPLGRDHQKEPRNWDGFDNAPDIKIIQQELQSAHYQLCTLGSGNHFLEIQSGSDGNVWVMIHSGSRNLGSKICHEYHTKAKELCEKYYSDIPDPYLSFLPMDTKDGQDYFVAMKFALAFAKENHRQMMMAVDESFKAILGMGLTEEVLYVHHNYAVLENHFGKNVMVHRKGAVKAYEGDKGIIPGSQGTASYIVRGIGNPDSFKSSSHGAGRKLGRGAAIRSLSLEDEKRKLDEKGIIHAIRTEKDLDEASGAYKDIDAVMANQRDLVEVEIKLTPLAVVKG